VIRDVLAMLNRMQADGVITDYAIGGAVGATFYLEPVSTVDVDVFVGLRPPPGRVLLDPSPIFEYLRSRGCACEGEYVIIAEWPVQFLVPRGPLVEEALEQAVVRDVEGVSARVFTAEHLAAIALETGRGKDRSRLLQFLESGVLDMPRFQAMVARFGLADAWGRFEQRYLGDPR
jgi:hypothetical protein